jgi:hypothetical protein
MLFRSHHGQGGKDLLVQEHRKSSVAFSGQMETVIGIFGTELQGIGIRGGGKKVNTP